MSTIYFIISQAPTETPMIHFDHYYSTSKREILDHMLKLAKTASQQYQVNGQPAKISPHDRPHGSHQQPNYSHLRHPQA